MYIGVHVPKSYRRRRRHRRKSSHKERRERADHGAEGYKSDGDYADESAAGVLKPLSESRGRTAPRAFDRSCSARVVIAAVSEHMWNVALNAREVDRSGVSSVTSVSSTAL